MSSRKYRSLKLQIWALFISEIILLASCLVAGIFSLIKLDIQLFIVCQLFVVIGCLVSGYKKELVKDVRAEERLNHRFMESRKGEDVSR
jgi:hypothetical protein